MAQESDELATIARRYERFARVEARGASDLYEQLALAVAGSSELLAFLCSMPPERRQPNLFLAAVRHQMGLDNKVGVRIEAPSEILWQQRRHLSRSPAEKVSFGIIGGSRNQTAIAWSRIGFVKSA